MINKKKREIGQKKGGSVFCPYINFDSYYDKTHLTNLFCYFPPFFSLFFSLQFGLMFSTRQSITFYISLNLFYQFVKH